MTRPEIILSPVLPNEVDVLRDMSIETFLDTYAWGNTRENMDNYLKASFGKERLTRELKDPNCLFFFARIKGDPVGYIKLNLAAVQTEFGDPESLEVERIYVLKSHQGKKIGKALIQKSMSVAKELGLNYVWLGVWEKNPRAIEFYKKNGFYEDGTHDFKLGTELQTDVIMKYMIS